MSANTTCEGSIFTDSSVECQNRACFNGMFQDSTVRCMGQQQIHSCWQSVLSRSTVDCGGNVACVNVLFYASAVSNCVGGSCRSSIFYSCSCCDGDRCPNGIPNCTDDLVGFCSTIFLEQTCKGWGNPACADVSSPPNLESPLGPTPSPLQALTTSPYPISPDPVNPPNSPPIQGSSPTVAPVGSSATNDGTVTTEHKTPVDIAAGESNPSSVEIVEPPLNGKAIVNEDKTITYTPNPSFAGQDRFEYEVCDVVQDCEVVEVRVYVTIAATSDIQG